MNKIEANVSKGLNSQLNQPQFQKSHGASRIYGNNNIALKINTILKEIKEVHSHVKYSIQHIDKRINEIENLLKNLTHS